MDGNVFSSEAGRANAEHGPMRRAFTAFMESPARSRSRWAAFRSGWLAHGRYAEPDPEHGESTPLPGAGDIFPVNSLAEAQREFRASMPTRKDLGLDDRGVQRAEEGRYEPGALDDLHRALSEPSPVKDLFVEAPADPWAHRSKGMRCSTCMWWVPKVRTAPDPGPGSLPVLGRCRRHGPTMSGFPATFEGDWCGDHKLDENRFG